MRESRPLASRERQPCRLESPFRWVESRATRREIEAATGAPGLTVVTVEIRRVEDIAPGFEALKARADLFRPIRS
jgi:hypothetical protein